MKFLLKGEGVWKLVNPEPQDANAANAANATIRTQGARTRTTESPTLQHPPTDIAKKKFPTGRQGTYRVVLCVLCVLNAHS